jgi:FlaG/FlaF family flagellin (archaellin)
MGANSSRSRSLTRAALRPVAATLALVLILAACSGSELPFVPSAEAAPQQRELIVTATEATTRAPIVGVTVTAGGATAMTGDDGRATLTAAPGASLAASADGYDPATSTVPDEGDLTVALRSNVASGTITDADGKAVEGAKVYVDGQATYVRTDRQGEYTLLGVPAEGTLIVKLAGYRLAAVPIDGELTRDVALEPFEARGLYAPGAVFEGAGRLDDLLRLIDRTEANAMVIDVYETGGYM